MIALRKEGLKGLQAVKRAKEIFEKVSGKNFDEYFSSRSGKFSGNTINMFKGIIKDITEGTLKPSALLIGPPGVGKTSLVYAVARDLNRRVFELNASDFRTSQAIRTHVMKALTTPSMDPQSLKLVDHLVFLDEVDGLSAIGDSGGMSALASILRSDERKRFIRYPLILAANKYKRILRYVRSHVHVFRFYRLNTREVEALLERILRREIRRLKLRIDRESEVVKNILHRIAIASSGDLRSALNDLQMYLETGVDIPSRKNREEEIDYIIRMIISDRVKDISSLRRALADYDGDLDELIYRVWENIPLYAKKAESLSKAYRLLAEADRIYNRAQRGFRGLLRYVSLLAGYPLVAYIDTKPKRNPYYPKAVKAKKPEIYQKIREIRSLKELREEAYENASKLLHLSKKKFVSEMVPYLRAIALYDPHVLLSIGIPDEVILSLVPEKKREEVINKLAEKPKERPKRIERREEKKEAKEEVEEKKEEKPKKEKKIEKKEPKEEPKEKKGTLEDYIGDLF